MRRKQIVKPPALTTVAAMVMRLYVVGGAPGWSHRSGQRATAAKADSIQLRQHHDPGSRRSQGVGLRVLPEG
ncbi:exported hypothetical protein [Candidatus Contendobacter odensis Run_B_J11]|uniref:Uncharacterized protein n=1 Tax=Candidatus Contendobacter odensis Run_B_J11 TaxID=1400861 RepID=A0A7U7GCW5_9GAMM|nr:exported hypothetical protein [Candidatus Contendobacter odensis Run_B_J11]